MSQLFAIATTILLVLSTKPNRQEYIHRRGKLVMPFDLDATEHVFTTIPNGGIQRLRVRNPNDLDNLAAIRQHLQQLRNDFSRGDFTAPKLLHGPLMAGIDILSAKHHRLNIRYSDTCDGAQLSYTSTDPVVVDALHRWFGAQLHDHGSNATRHK